MLARTAIAVGPLDQPSSPRAGSAPHPFMAPSNRPRTGSTSWATFSSAASPGMPASQAGPLPSMTRGLAMWSTTNESSGSAWAVSVAAGMSRSRSNRS
jgi:hypothetical protein